MSQGTLLDARLVVTSTLIRFDVPVLVHEVIRVQLARFGNVALPESYDTIVLVPLK
jgi:hypothetical protein